MVYNSKLDAISNELGFTKYLTEIKKFPLLKPKEEFELATRYRNFDDREAAHKLVTSHLRYVVKIAMGYRGYGFPVGEIISEGNIGLMRAVKAFIPEKGVRLATYAMWWIKSSIHEYVLRSWSLVKIGTTTEQKKIFFNLRKLKNKISAFNQEYLTTEQAQQIAQTLRVSENEVRSMDQRLFGDQSLNVSVAFDDSKMHEWQDFLVDDSKTQEQILLENDELEEKKKILQEALCHLKLREKEIFQARRLREIPVTLEKLSEKYQISRERVRQIENRAFEKIQDFIKK